MTATRLPAPTRRNFLIGTGAVAALWLAGTAPANAAPQLVPTRSGPGPALQSDNVSPEVAAVVIAEIKHVKARYFRAIDTKNWDLLAEQLTGDVTVDTTDSAGPVLTGRAVFVNFLKVSLALNKTVHHGHTPEIEVTSPTTAKVVWGMQDLLIYPAGLRVIGFGHYHEDYRVEDGQWRIAYSKLTRLYLDPLGQRALFGM